MSEKREVNLLKAPVVCSKHSILSDTCPRHFDILTRLVRCFDQSYKRRADDWQGSVGRGAAASRASQARNCRPRFVSGG